MNMTSELTTNQLIDPYRRKINYLRISITDRCNLRCIYCNPGHPSTKLHHREILRYEEILRIIRIGVSLGITKVRITGGEPLVRKGCCDFLQKIGCIQGIHDLALTTNGVLLGTYVDQIINAGIKRLNISLDTLNPQKYARITGADAFDQVWNGILTAFEKGIHPIKINVVALKGINEDELLEFAKLTFKYPFHIRFIEYMPIGIPLNVEGAAMLLPEIRSRIHTLGRLIAVENGLHDGPASRFRFLGAIGEIGFISPVSRHFCAACNRLRLTADGHMLSCLLSSVSQDIKTPLREGLLDDAVAQVFQKAVHAKPMQRPQKISPRSQPEKMVSIGG